MSSQASLNSNDEGDSLGTDDEHTFKILIATDNHLGFMEEDTIRGQDSFRTFEEILYIAKVEKVDFVLLGGDLFHQNTPSRACLYQTMKMLRRHCYGDRPSQIWIASDQSVNFPEEFCTANYLDENINISLPIFSIHGNHDDPSGTGNLCALHLLSVGGMVNYFGASPKVDDVVIHPILMEKGRSKLALYGLGNIRDERLHRHWQSGHVKFMRPEDEDWRGNNCFNMFVLHQNRRAHGRKGFIPEEFIDGFLDLVIWGHEHDCLIDPTPFSRFAISQPGSSVATSLIGGESIDKHVGLVKVKGTSFSMEKIRLKTVRPFIYAEIKLSNNDRNIVPTNVKEIQDYLAGEVEKLINKAKVEFEAQQKSSPYNLPFWEYDDLTSTSSERPEMPLPLIRLRVDYSGGYETFNPSLFGQRFINRVANNRDILKFKKSSGNATEMQQTAREALRAQTEVLTDLTMAIPDRLDTVKVESLVEELLSRDLFILPETKLENALMDIVTKDEKSAIKSFFNKSIKQATRNVQFVPDMNLTLDYVKRKTTDFKESVNQMLDNERAAATATPDEQRANVTPAAARGIASGTEPGTSDASRTIWNSDDDADVEQRQQTESQSQRTRQRVLSDDDMEIETPAPSQSRGPTSTRARGGKRGSGRGSKSTSTTRGKRGRGASASTSGKRRIISDEEEEEMEVEEPIEEFSNDEDDADDIIPSTQTTSRTNRQRTATQPSSYVISDNDDEDDDRNSVHEEVPPSSSTTRGNSRGKGKSAIGSKRAAPSNSPLPPAATSLQTPTTDTQDTQSSQKKRRKLPNLSQSKKR